MNELISYIKECKAAIIVLNDMTSLSYGIRDTDESIKNISDIGVLGIAFRKYGNEIEYITWRKSNNSYIHHKEMLKNEHERLLHHSFGSNKRLIDIV